jgi:hypothetical protein
MPRGTLIDLAVALVAGGAAIINRRAAWTAGVLSHVGRDSDAAHVGYKSLGVLHLVGTEGLLLRTRRSATFSLAASRSPVPTAWVMQQSTISAWQLSMSTWVR